MREKIKILFLILFISITSLAQELKTFDVELITRETKLNLISSNKRGIETEKKEIYFVETDNQTISYYLNGILKWKVNVIKKCGRPKVGKSEIRFIEIIKDKMLVTFGKPNYAEIDLKNGKAKFIGAD
jgi:hypothetical protein